MQLLRELIIDMLQQISLTTVPVIEATVSSASNLVQTAVAEPWFIQLWNAPGFSEFATGILIAASTLIGVSITTRHQKRQEILNKKKQVAENILNPFNEVLLGFEEIVGNKKDLPLMARAVMSTFYSLDIEEKELRKQLNKPQTLANLYTPNYINGLVSHLSSQCFGLFGQEEIEESRFQQFKELVDDLSKDLIKWIGSDEIKGKDKTFKDIAREVEKKNFRK
mgnify:CR=1 FL=1